MSFRVAIRSAPRRAGTVGAPSAFSGGSTITVTSGGLYSGSRNKTFTFTMGGAATWHPASHKVTWSDGTNTGSFQVGSSYYTEADPILVAEGVLLYFSGTEAVSTIASADTFTVAVTARNALDGTFREVSGDGAPASTYLSRSRVAAADFEGETWDARRRVVTRALQTSIDSIVDYLDAANLEKAQHLLASRHQVTVGENYDADTRFLWRGGGLMPLVGPALTFSRSGVGAYYDRQRELWRHAASGDPRIEAGPIGPALTYSRAATNADTVFHADSTGAQGWITQSGSPVAAWDSYVPGVLDMTDTTWGTKYNGSLRVEFDTGEAIRSTSQPATSASTTYTSQVYICGRGAVAVAMYTDTGAGTPTTLITSETVTLTSMAWRRIVLTGTSAGGATVRHIRITAAEKSMIWISAKQQEVGFTASAIIKTDGGTATRNAESLVLSPFTLPLVGTLSLWFRVAPGDIGLAGNPYAIFESTGSATVSLRYDPTGGPTLSWDMGGGAPTLTTTVTLAEETWHHVVVVWERDATGGVTNRLKQYIYHQGVLLASTSGGVGWAHSGESSWSFGKSGGGLTDMFDWRFAEARIDARAWSAAEVADQYQRLTEDEWIYLHRLAGGRYYRMDDVAYSWMDDFNVDKCLATIALGESDREDESLVTGS